MKIAPRRPPNSSPSISGKIAGFQWIGFQTGSALLKIGSRRPIATDSNA